jgi:hypothetical protein
MKSFSRFIRLIAPVFILVGALHVVFGLGAEKMLSIDVSNSSLASPGLDSQNRFYGAAFMLYGALLFVASADLKRYLPIVRLVLWCFFIAGMARFFSVMLYGWPSMLVNLLHAIEIVGPPLLLLWLRRVEAEMASST